MGIADLFNDIDTENIGDFLSDPIGGFKKLFSSFLDTDSLFSGDEYPAVALTNAVEIDYQEARALGFVESADNPFGGTTLYKFKVRTVVKGGPHIVLSDPCLLTDAKDAETKCLVNALIAAHTTVVTTFSGIGVGDIVQIKFDRNSDNTLNLRTANFKAVTSRSDLTSLTPEACDFIAAVFELDGGFIPPPNIDLKSEIVELAEKYDKAKNLIYKSENNKFIAQLLKPFDLYAKAFVYLAKEELNADVQFTDGTRSAADQKNRYDKSRSGKSGLPAAPPTNGITEKSSCHRVGLALDFNFIIDGFRYSAPKSQKPLQTFDGTAARADTNIASVSYEGPAGLSAHKQSWIDTGIVDLLENRLDLTWGGNFNSSYDPIHFELTPSSIGVTKKAAYSALQTGKSLGITLTDDDGFAATSETSAEFEDFQIIGESPVDVAERNIIDVNVGIPTID